MLAKLEQEKLKQERRLDRWTITWLGAAIGCSVVALVSYYLANLGHTNLCQTIRLESSMLAHGTNSVAAATYEQGRHWLKLAALPASICYLVVVGRLGWVTINWHASGRSRIWLICLLLASFVAAIVLLEANAQFPESYCLSYGVMPP